MAILNSLPTGLNMASETSNGLMSAEDKILVNKINRIELDVANKINRTDKIRSNQLDTSSNAAKIQPENLSKEVKDMMTGTTPVAPEIEYKSLVTEYFADSSVTTAKRTPGGAIAVIVADEFCNFDTTGDTEVVLSIPANYTIYYGAQYETIENAQEYINLPKGERSVIVYSKSYGLAAYSDSAAHEMDYIIGAFDGTYVTMFNGKYTVNGSVVVADESLDGAAVKDFSLDSKKLAIQHGIILEDKSEPAFLNVNFTSKFVEVLKEFTISIADQHTVVIKASQECSIPENTLNREFLYIYFDLGIKKLNAIWASNDITTTILNNNEKLVLIGIIRGNKATGLNREFIAVNAVNLRLTDINYARILTGRIVIDFKNKQITANNVKAFVDDELLLLSEDGNQNISLSDDVITDIINIGIPYTLGAVRTDFNRDSYRLVFKKTEDIRELGLDAIPLTSIEKYNLSNNIESVSVVKADGSSVKSSNIISNGYTLPIDDQTIVLKLSTTIEEGNLILTAKTVPNTSVIDPSTNIQYDIKEELKYTTVVENLRGLYSILYNTETGQIEVRPINIPIINKIYVSLGFVYGLNDSLSYKAVGPIVDHIILNDNRPSNYVVLSAPDPDKGYDWSKNRLVLPDDIYLLANSQYSLYCQNMSMNRYIDNDYILYELGLPNTSVLSENVINVNSPILGDFESRLIGKFKGNNSCLFKDVNFHFVKPEAKELSVLCIGDDTVDLNMPGYIKTYLTQLGYTPTMLGTKLNSIDINGYGMKNLESEKGEGHKGWRVTDFMCKTKHKDESPYYIANNPFMNNSTFDFAHYMTTNAYDKVDVVVVSMGLNDIIGYHTDAVLENIKNLTIAQNIEQLPNIYKEMIANIHAYDPNIKIIINPTMIKGIDDSFNRDSLLLTETLIHDLKNINNVFITPGYLTQPLFVAANKASTNDYEVSSDINNTKIGGAVSSFELNGVAQSNLAYTIVSTIVGVC